MKKSTLLAGLIACIFFMSCKKDSVSSTNSNTGTELQSTISFTVDSITYTVNGSLADSAYDGSIFTKSPLSVPGSYYYDSIGLDYYLLVENSSLNLTMSIPSRTLTTTTYNLSNTGNYAGTIPASFYTNPSQVGIVGNGIYSTTITIQSIHDGAYADGTFSGTFNIPNSQNYLNLTNGTFKNVKILY